jgi:hypothetical protein
MRNRMKVLSILNLAGASICGVLVGEYWPRGEYGWATLYTVFMIINLVLYIKNKE